MLSNKLIFEPTHWHSCHSHDWRNCNRGINCYSYALNSPHYHWSVPGLGYIKSYPQPYFDSFNAHFKDFSLAEYREAIINGAISDGLIPVADQTDKAGYYVVALRFNDDPKSFDFDWYRKDHDGLWSHKDGWHMPTNLDDNKKPINDPQHTADKHYPIFASFFLVPRTGIILTKQIPIAQS